MASFGPLSSRPPTHVFGPRGGPWKPPPGVREDDGSGCWCCLVFWAGCAGLIMFIGLYLGLFRYFAQQPNSAQQPNCHTFPETRMTVCERFLQYWTEHGGLAQFGYPISDPLSEKNPIDGKTYIVQYFERARFELHPESAGTPYEVLLGLLGRQFHPTDLPAVPINDANHHYFKETGHNVSNLFFTYWHAHGGLFVNGYPISEEFQEKASDGKIYTVQYFERARYEAHPENQPPYNVLLGFLGRQAWGRR